MPDQTTLAGWKKAAVHEVTCPSGVKISIRLPDIPALIEAGHLPQHLLDAAISVARSAAEGPNVPTAESVKENRELVRKLVSYMVVAPKLSEPDVDELPSEDREMLMEMAMRTRDLDAVGEHIGGLHKSESFRLLRGLPERDPILASLQGSREADSELA